MNSKFVSAAWTSRSDVCSSLFTERWWSKWFCLASQIHSGP